MISLKAPLSAAVRVGMTDIPPSTPIDRRTIADLQALAALSALDRDLALPPLTTAAALVADGAPPARASERDAVELEVDAMFATDAAPPECDRCAAYARQAQNDFTLAAQWQAHAEELRGDNEVLRDRLAFAQARVRELEAAR